MGFESAPGNNSAKENDRNQFEARSKKEEPTTHIVKPAYKLVEDLQKLPESTREGLFSIYIRGDKTLEAIESWYQTSSQALAEREVDPETVETLSNVRTQLVTGLNNPLKLDNRIEKAKAWFTIEAARNVENVEVVDDLESVKQKDIYLAKKSLNKDTDLEPFLREWEDFYMKFRDLEHKKEVTWHDQTQLLFYRGDDPATRLLTIKELPELLDYLNQYLHPDLIEEGERVRDAIESQCKMADAAPKFLENIQYQRLYRELSSWHGRAYLELRERYLDRPELDYAIQLSMLKVTDAFSKRLEEMLSDRGRAAVKELALPLGAHLSENLQSELNDLFIKVHTERNADLAAEVDTWEEEAWRYFAEENFHHSPEKKLSTIVDKLHSALDTESLRKRTESKRKESEQVISSLPLLLDEDGEWQFMLTFVKCFENDDSEGLEQLKQDLTSRKELAEDLLASEQDTSLREASHYIIRTKYYAELQRVNAALDLLRRRKNTW